MLRLLKSKIAFKVILALIGVVLCIGYFPYEIIKDKNTSQLKQYLEDLVKNTINFIELGYADQVWDIDIEGITKLNEAVLKNREIVGINVFSADGFITGLRKSDANDGQNIILTKPFNPTPKNNYLRKKGEIIYVDRNIGHFELFYTDKYVQVAIDEGQLYIIMFFLAIAVAIIGSGYFFIRLFTIKPIYQIQEVLTDLAKGAYSRRINTRKQDELGILSNVFNKMADEIESGYRTLQESEKRYRSLFENLQQAINNEDYSVWFEPLDETDDLSESLNKILKNLEISDMEAKNQNWLKTGQTELNTGLTGVQTIDDLSRNAIVYLSKYLNTQIGAIYVIQEFEGEAPYLQLAGSYAYQCRKSVANRFKLGEGLVGQAALEKERLLFSHIPDDYIQIQSGLGSTKPRHILVFPLVYEDKVKGVIEMGSCEEFTDLQIEFIEIVASNIAIAINSTQFNDKLKALLDKTRIQADELQKQQGELKHANIELEEQTRILKDSEAKLQIQQEELRATNEEMAEKNVMLEEQKKEIEKKNRSLQQKQVEVEEKARELELATKYKSEFLANMSHELRTPLNSLLLLSKLLSENDENNLTDEQVESITSIHRSGVNLLNLINDILDLSKIEAKKIELKIDRIAISSLTRNMSTEFKHLAKSKKLDFGIHIEEGLPEYLVTDTMRLEQIIRNLLSNAFKFTSRGAVNLNVTRPEPGARLWRKDLALDKCIAIAVEDTGIGIPKEKQQLIFEAFQQADGSISRKHGGTGLGLSISRELTNLIGGELKLRSKEDGGTIFTLYLPEVFNLTLGEMSQTAKPDHEPDLEPKAAPTRTPVEDITQKPAFQEMACTDEQINFTNDKTMLIIEDDSEFAQILSKQSQNRGYHCIIAPNGELGIKYALQYQPTAIILDIGLPGIDGWGVLDELKNNSDTRHIPVHIISAYDKKQAGLEKGAMGYLTKPVNPEQLNEAFARIEKLVSARIKELLIIEDDDELRQTIIRLMQSNDINITAVKTGKEAFELIRSKNFNCIILDFGLPDIDGMQLLENICSDISIPHIPIIIYTGRELTEEEHAQIKNCTAGVVLKKAASLDRLLDETTLFLHRVESNLPEEQQRTIRQLHDKDSVLIGKKALIVDDDMRNAFALSKLLKKNHMETSIADNGQKALNLLDQENDIDIVLMDIMMPVMDGFETMRRIRAQERFEKLPILAITAKAMACDREQSIEAGANDYISKPVDPSKLLSMIRVWVYPKRT